MAPQEFERKLTAILSADVVEYRRLMGEDAHEMMERYEETITYSKKAVEINHPIVDTDISLFIYPWRRAK